MYYSKYSLARQHQRQAVDFRHLLLGVHLLVLERSHQLHAVQHRLELVARHAQRLEQRAVHLRNKQIIVYVYTDFISSRFA